MVAKLVTIFVIIFAFGAEAKKLPLPPQHPYLMHVNLEFKEENITQFIAESFFASNGLTPTPTTAQCNISLFDIVNAIPFKKMTDADISTAFGTLGIILEDDDIQMFLENMNYTELSSMGFSTSRMFKTFVKTYFTNGTTQLLSVLEAFDVGEEFTVAYAFGTDEEMFNALKEAEFSAETITEVEALLNTTFTLKDISNILGIKKLDSLYVQEFVNTNLTNFLLTKELQQVNFEAFLTALNFTLHEYKDMKSFKTCYKALTQSSTLAVAVSPNEIITNDDTVLQNHLSLSAYTSLSISSVQDKKLIVSMTTHNITADGFTTFSVVGPLASYIEETTSYEGVATKACTYVTENLKNIVSQPATVQMDGTQVKIAKLPSTIFKKSSPIVCDGKLFGLASTEDISSINFNVFEVVAQPEDVVVLTPAVSITQDPELVVVPTTLSATSTTQDPAILAMVNEMFKNFLLTFNPCNYMVCASTPAPDVVPESPAVPEVLPEVEEQVVEELPTPVEPEVHQEPLPEEEVVNVAPAVPEVEVPAVPEAEVSVVPEVEVPAVPEIEVPAVPDVEVPAVPEIEAPAVAEPVQPENEVQEPSSPTDVQEVIEPQGEVLPSVIVEEPIAPVVQEPADPQISEQELEQIQVEGEIQEPAVEESVPEVVAVPESTQEEVVVETQDPTLPVVQEGVEQELPVKEAEVAAPEKESPVGVEEVAAEVVEEVPQEVVDEVPQAEEIPQEVVEEVPQAIVEEVPQEVVEDVPQEVVEEVVPEVVEQVVPEVVEEVPQAVVEEVAPVEEVVQDSVIAATAEEVGAVQGQLVEEPALQ